jgi:glycosyltransferase involved in cell wall biosynthesis
VVLVLGTSTGGVGVHVRSLAEFLVAEGWPVTVAAPTSTLDHFDFAATGAEVAIVPISGPGREALAVPALRRATRRAALVHAHGLRAGTVGVLARRRPLVVTWHNAVLARGLRARVLGAGEALVARRATINLVASSDLAARVRRLGGHDVRLAPVAPPVPRPQRSVAEVRAELGLSHGQPLVVSIGRLHSQKSHDVLIAAATGWADLGASVVIAGEGPERAGLTAMIERADAPVRLLGHRRDVADLLAAADVVVLASRWEARPLVVQEAMRLGRAVVATDVGGVGELVGPGASIVAAGAPTALADAVRGLLQDPAARARLGTAALVQAAGWPGERDSAEQVAGTYRDLLTAAGR